MIIRHSEEFVDEHINLMLVNKIRDIGGSVVFCYGIGEGNKDLANDKNLFFFKNKKISFDNIISEWSKSCLIIKAKDICNGEWNYINMNNVVTIHDFTDDRDDLSLRFNTSRDGCFESCFELNSIYIGSKKTSIKNVIKKWEAMWNTK